MLTDVNSIITHYKGAKTMTNFEGLQDKFIVIKREDVRECLYAGELEQFKGLLERMAGRINALNRGVNHYLVINTDEPYAAEIVDILKANGHWGEGDPIKQPLTITEMVKTAHTNAVDKGWWEEDRSFGECISLIHSEASEALEDYRDGHIPTKDWYEGDSEKFRALMKQDTRLVKDIDWVENHLYVSMTPHPGWKPCGIPSELADIVIRVADLSGRHGIDLERAIKEKMAYNATRSHRHGGKKL